MIELVLFSELSVINGKKVGVVMFNMECKLNLFNSEMVLVFIDQFKLWEKDNNVVVVWLQGVGEKVFCVGGDVCILCEMIIDVGVKKVLFDVQVFFENEYWLDYLIYVYVKFIIVWGYGIIMGGGIGLMLGVLYWVVMEMFCMVMLEIFIGLYFDVGGIWFLNYVLG